LKRGKKGKGWKRVNGRSTSLTPLLSLSSLCQKKKRRKERIQAEKKKKKAEEEGRGSDLCCLMVSHIDYFPSLRCWDRRNSIRVEGGGKRKKKGMKGKGKNEDRPKRS